MARDKNPVAKNLRKFNKAKVYTDRKKEEKKTGQSRTGNKHRPLGQTRFDDNCSQD